QGRGRLEANAGVVQEVWSFIGRVESNRIERTPSMSRRFQLILIFILASAMGSPGCRRSPSAPSTAPAGTSAQSGLIKSPPVPGIPPDKLGSILAAHYRGLGHMHRYEYDSAGEACCDERPPWSEDDRYEAARGLARARSGHGRRRREPGHQQAP